MAGKKFNDQLSVTQGRNGLASQQMGMNTQTAQDRNQAIQGIGQAGMGYMDKKRGDARWNEEQDREDQRAKWKYGTEDDE